ncbi:MAG: putative toxin-antitoxin system toxin component, PIN family [Desulfurellaceae bacterium]|nr:putative toxin-antitoxin system toxin component, PIN family [Desulfurellaceae bacterium]
MRVVIDTNIWISFLIGKALCGLEEHLNKKVRVVASDEQLQEIISVINRPKFNLSLGLIPRSLLRHSRESGNLQE